MNYDLSKKLDLAKGIIYNLAKTKNLDGQKAKVKLALDISGSMSTLYSSGYVQQVIERILPLGMQFDDDQSVELYLFHHGVMKVKDINLSNVEGFVKRDILGKYNFGTTNYAPVINMITEDHSPSKSKGFLNSLFGKKEDSVKTDLPSYVIFITDGNNDDKSAAIKAITEASQKGVFFSFVGIGYEKFQFLQELDTLQGRLLDNASFFKATDLTKISDDELYNSLLKEFPEWVKEAKIKGLINNI